ncbi:hypothetical protein GCWU000246_01493 [Jonquetella anthropi E3_33 E1]|nr:hypothetical protein GCWU000246_01493 [Jonquetella anthropi E3_33 E1]
MDMYDPVSWNGMTVYVRRTMKFAGGVAHLVLFEYRRQKFVKCTSVLD